MSTYPSDLEIANAAHKKPIDEIAKSIEIQKKDLITVSYTHLTLPTKA